jgi:O-methyltransferase
MSIKRDLLGRIFPNGIPFTAAVNNNAVFVRMRRERISSCPEPANRMELYRQLASHIGNGPIDYLEFGVFEGASIGAWAKLNTNPNSRFFGFDTFEGLPEDWLKNYRKGHFSTNGIAPKFDDQRVTFTKGLFQKTLIPFLNRTELKNRIVVNVDCDIYSATLFVLTTLNREMPPGTIIILDDFSSVDHEFRAFSDYERSFGRNWRALGKLAYCSIVAIELD